MGIMIIPFVSSLSDDVINAVPQIAARRLLRARRHQVGDHPPGGDPGRAAGHRRRRAAGGQSRAIGETMIVVMAAGLAANLTANPLAGRDHGHRADRHAAGRRPGVRQRQDAVRLRARPGAVRASPSRSTSSPSRRADAIEKNMTDAAIAAARAGRPRRRARPVEQRALRRALRGRAALPGSTAWRRSGCAVRMLGILLVTHRRARATAPSAQTLRSALDVNFDPAVIDPAGHARSGRAGQADYGALVQRRPAGAASPRPAAAQDRRALQRARQLRRGPGSCAAWCWPTRR